MSDPTHGRHRKPLFRWLRHEVRQLADDTDSAINSTDEQAEITELRVIALEEVLAARWPRRIVVRRRLIRDLRASVRGYGWVGPDFESRRIQAIGDGWIKPLRQR